LDEEFDKSSILGELVALGLENNAETWVNKLGKEYQVCEQMIRMSGPKSKQRL
jgi:hypothetical protein